jgi:hypothetical protein
MDMHFDLKKAFRQAAAVIVMAVAGAGAGGYAYHSTHGTLDAHHTPQSAKAVAVYEDRIKVIQQKQTSLVASSDEEAGSKLERWKRAFISDVVLDTTISETDVGRLASEFNRLGADDDVVFHFQAENPSSVRERNEALNDVLLTNDRIETAERTQDCMLAYAAKDHEGTETAAETGAIVGVALAGSFLLGLMAGRRRKPDALKAA